jgi:hypothetical protein
VIYTVLGIGAVERSWGDVNQRKSSKCAHLCIEYVEHQSVIFGAASSHKNAGTAEGVKTPHMTWASGSLALILRSSIILCHQYEYSVDGC